MADYDKLAREYMTKRERKDRLDYNRHIEMPAILRLIGDVKGKNLLDMGCGFGDHAKELAARGYKSLIGFDISSELVKFAQSMEIPRATFYVGDMSKKLRYEDNSFDIVYSALAIHYISNLKRLFSEVHRVLKPGGFFVFSTGNPIFSLLNQTDDHMVGAIKHPNGKRTIHGNYFDETRRLYDLGGFGKLMMHHYTFETLIKAGLDNCFELVDYVDAKPVKMVQKIDPERYRLTTTLPTFAVFKFKKKRLQKNKK